LNKRLFGVLIEELGGGTIPQDLSDEWQIIRLDTGRDHLVLHATIPITHETVEVHFSEEGL
jgi:hypothetical protein